MCCSVLRTEVEALWKEHWPDYKLVFLPSIMHLDPHRLSGSLGSVLRLEEGQRVLLIYGDCCVQMAALESKPGVVRTGGKNCCELLLGPEEYRRLSHEGAFFLSAEWAQRWKEIFTTGFGLNQTNATSFMRDLHHKLVYLDTGIVPVPESDLQECSQFCGLPYEVRRVSLEFLRTTIAEALRKLEALQI